MKHLTQRWPVWAGRTSWLIAAAISILLLAALSFIDVRISVFGQGLPGPVIEVFAWITRLGDSDYILIPSLVLFLISAGLALLIRTRVPRLALWQMTGVWAFVFVGVGLPSLFTTIIKRLIGRSRPELVDSVGPLDFQTVSWLDWTYQSFPSGHATTGFALCFVVSFLTPRFFPWMLALAVLIGLSRIVVGAHYPTDVIGGALVGTLGAYFVRNFFAARGWVFEVLPDGGIGLRPLVAVERLLQRRRASITRPPASSRPRP